MEGDIPTKGTGTQMGTWPSNAGVGHSGGHPHRGQGDMEGDMATKGRGTWREGDIPTESRGTQRGTWPPRAGGGHGRGHGTSTPRVGGT